MRKGRKPAKRKLPTSVPSAQAEIGRRCDPAGEGDGKAHTVQDSIPFQNMFPDGLCVAEGGASPRPLGLRM